MARDCEFDICKDIGLQFLCLVRQSVFLDVCIWKFPHFSFMVTKVLSQVLRPKHQAFTIGLCTLLRMDDGFGKPVNQHNPNSFSIKITAADLF